MNWARIYDFAAPLYKLLLGFPLFGLDKEQLAAVPHVRGHRVLEVGCGTGLVLSRIADEEREVVGLDISPGMLAQARKRLSSAGRKVRLVQGSYYDISFSDKSFDCVVATFTLTHAPDLNPVAAEIARVLKPGGRLVIVDVGPSAKPRWGSRLINGMWRLLGDYPRDETPILVRAGLKVIFRKEISKLGTVHLLVAEKRDSA